MAHTLGRAVHLPVVQAMRGTVAGQLVLQALTSLREKARLPLAMVPGGTAPALVVVLGGTVPVCHRQLRAEGRAVATTPGARATKSRRR
jgi:hypothetical protein